MARLDNLRVSRGFAPKVNLRLMVRQVPTRSRMLDKVCTHHERKYENPFALSLSKGHFRKGLPIVREIPRRKLLGMTCGRFILLEILS